MSKQHHRMHVPHARCCGMNVNTCATMIAAFGIVLCSLCLINIFMPSLSITFSKIFFPESTAVKYQFFTLVFINFIAFFMLVINALVIHGARKERPWAFVPYLVVNGAWITFWLLLAVFMLLMGNFAPNSIVDNLPRKDIKEETVKTASNVFAITVLLLIAIPTLCWLSIYRAYRHAKYLHGGNHHDAAALLH